MRFWVVSRNLRIRLTTLGALTVIAILAVMAASALMQSPSFAPAMTSDLAPAGASAGEHSVENGLAPPGVDARAVGSSNGN